MKDANVTVQQAGEARLVSESTSARSAAKTKQSTLPFYCRVTFEQAALPGDRGLTQDIRQGTIMLAPLSPQEHTLGPSSENALDRVR